MIVILSLFTFPSLADTTEPVYNLDKDSVEEYVNKLITEKMEEMHIPGVTISIVQGDEMLLCKGYGYQDIDK